MYYTQLELEDMGFASVGKNVKVFKSSILINPEYIHLGDECQIDDFTHIIAGSSVKIGKRVHFGCFSSIAGGGEVIIEDYCGVAAGCRLISGSDDFTGGAMTNPCVPFEYRNVIRSFIYMKKHSLLGTNSIVLSSITLEEGATTLAGTLVNKNLEAWKIYAGSPARLVKERERETIQSYEKELIKNYGY
jgi:galactoside O-acetyltransferase